jgi:hypothetical protein
MISLWSRSPRDEKEKVTRQKEKGKGEPSVFLPFAFFLLPCYFFANHSQRLTRAAGSSILVGGEKEKVTRQKEKGKAEPSVFLPFAFLLLPFSFGVLTAHHSPPEIPS